MRSAEVKLGKSIVTARLETILIGAAGDIGWNASVERVHSNVYKLGSVQKETPYLWSEVRLKGAFLPLANITLDEKEWFHDSVRLYFGFATQKEVMRYLHAVSQRVQEYQPPTSVERL